MKYTIIEQTPVGAIPHESPTARQALSFLKALDAPASKVTIRDEAGQKLDVVDLELRAQWEADGNA